LGNSTGFSNIPIKFESTANGTLTINDIRLDYAGGNDTIEIKAHNLTYEVNETTNITVYYSKWDYNFPLHIDYLEFIPSTSSSKNVTPYGQTKSTPIFNITTLNYGGKNMNLSIYLNETNSCVNLTWNTNSTKPTSSYYKLNNTWKDTHTDKAYLSNNKIWLWADYSCDYKNWSLWNPQIYIKGCCLGCTCSDELT